MVNGKDGLGMVVGAFIAILVGVIFAGVIGDEVVGNTEVSSINHESITISAGGGNTANDDVVGFSFFGNATNNTDLADINFGLEVNVSKNGSVFVTQNMTDGTTNQTVFSDGTYNISYQHEGAGFVKNSTARTLLKLVTLFFVFGVVFIGITMFRRMFPDFMS